MTSANVTRYVIRKGPEVVGEHSQHAYCQTKWRQLLKYVPSNDYTIQSIWADEEEEDHYGERISLRQFLNKLSEGKHPALPRYNEEF